MLDGLRGSRWARHGYTRAAAKPPLLGHHPAGDQGLIYHYLTDPEWVLLSEDQIYVKEVDHT
jgi:hypothetical protein